MLECVPNFSEGRRPEVVARIEAAAAAAAGVRVLDRHVDPDHHRAVLTLAGEPAALVDGAVRAVAAAVEAIDLGSHQGAHPRIGAADVVPFVPLAGSTLADAVEAARAAGRRIGEELGVPVFLYGEAAARPDRRALPDIRRGGLEALRGRPALEPEFGPGRLHPTAGACCVGARGPLVAFNLELSTDDEELARRIARRVRESDGGLPGVRALGLRLASRGVAQVSLNLVDPGVTGLAEA
ncbi:MAG: glutamate formimidoyltransferase, partial [Planctomycetes bacterium]|nr:glutamate formimidoyltransferase [Planctomycetota bacterium]